MYGEAAGHFHGWVSNTYIRIYRYIYILGISIGSDYKIISLLRMRMCIVYVILHTVERAGTEAMQATTNRAL